MFFCLSLKNAEECEEVQHLKQLNPECVWGASHERFKAPTQILGTNAATTSTTSRPTCSYSPSHRLPCGGGVCVCVQALVVATRSWSLEPTVCSSVGWDTTLGSAVTSSSSSQSVGFSPETQCTFLRSEHARLSSLFKNSKWWKLCACVNAGGIFISSSSTAASMENVHFWEYLFFDF